MLWMQLVFYIQKACAGVIGYYTHTLKFVILIRYLCVYIHYNILVIPSQAIQPALKTQEKRTRIATVCIIKLSKI